MLLSDQIMVLMLLYDLKTIMLYNKCCCSKNKVVDNSNSGNLMDSIINFSSLHHVACISIYLYSKVVNCDNS